MEGQPGQGQLEGSTAVQPLQLPDAPKWMIAWAFVVKALGLPDPSSLTVDEQIAGEPMWQP